MDNYHSPYDLGYALDALLDVIADRHDMTPDELSDHIHKNRNGIYDWLDLEAWDEIIGPALDRLDDRIFPVDL